MARAPVRRRAARPVATSKPALLELPEGRRRVVIEAVSPEIDAGRFPATRAAGETVTVEADIFADGHDALAAVLRYRHLSSAGWIEVPMAPLANDRWRGEFAVTELGRYAFTVEAWVDHFATWSKQFAKRLEAGQDVSIELEVGAGLIQAAAARADGSATDAKRLQALAASMRQARTASSAPLDGELATLMGRHADRELSVTYSRELEVLVEPERARCSTWYEMFPRSAGEAGRHGTFKDVEKQLPRIAEMGFDVLYFPPIHPIGRTNRKGANNRPAAAGEPGSPWAIGAEEGGHKAIHPQLGTLDDFRHLVSAAAGRNIEIALDIAFQCSPDHPYIREHPEWFRHRPDGSIQYAENPPKKYEDIVPFDFETEAWRELWQELLSIFVYWIEQGVHVFRVDNPHTKPFAFWEWVIGEVKRDHPDVILLSEAFTRPRVMYRLAKAGFSQSYTYFAWRNTAPELYQYFTELAQPPIREFFRPNLWPNTPDILTEYLQHGGRSAFMARLVLAATLGAGYGIYGPAFELCESRAREQGSEEYLDSEKYQIRHWDLDAPDNLRELITLINEIRRENPALQTDRGLRFHPTENDQLLAYSKSTADRRDVLLMVVNVDPHHTQAGMVSLPLAELGLEGDRPYQAHELLSGARYLWTGPRNYVEINPHAMPAQIFRFRRRLRSEHDFEYFL
ncbi:MAG TPA: alpha-1,4-glucan--maltose-1-phosphate maltosyltransferase [Candidatus Dormibacteraeota bacterium]|nr:alpha-1,4-glucan--maltose-1-phosphate maltosyltransferase [Candidatus Dormibacteraeota bacterium]